MYHAGFHDEDDMLGAASARLFADTCPPAVARAARAGTGTAAAPGAGDAVAAGPGAASGSGLASGPGAASGRGASTVAAWDAFVASGTADALLAEAAGGAGLGLGDIASTFLAAGYHAVPFPAADTVLARAWLARAGVTPPDGAIALAPSGWRRDNDSVHGTRVPWLRCADYVLASVAGQACLLPVARADISDIAPHGALSGCASWAPGDVTVLRSATGSGASIAHNASTASIASSAAQALAESDTLDALAACAYAGIAAGALTRVLHLTLAYANDRCQFGKPIGRFQAIQQQLAVMAEQVWAARSAAGLVLQGPRPYPRRAADALAWGRVCEAIVPVCDIAHAVHGAIGITQEHDLGIYTSSLREWRLALGSESAWYARVGAGAMESDLSALDLVRQLCGEI